MESTRLKVARIGNSRGVRIPARTLDRYRIGDTVVMEERSEGILLRPVGQSTPKLSWDETAREMADQVEDWSAWEGAIADGLETIPWAKRGTTRVAERGAGHRPRSRRPR